MNQEDKKEECEHKETKIIEGKNHSAYQVCVKCKKILVFFN